MATYNMSSKLDLSTYTHSNLTTDQTHLTTTQWDNCDSCQPRPYMNIVLIVTLLLLIILRKSSFLHNWSQTQHENRIKEEEEEEQVGLMQRVF